MSAITVDVVRVFTNDEGDFGNELGIILATPGSDGAATSGREQAIAAELGFSETVFISEVADRAAADGSAESVAVIRIFTPAGELPFAGHPSVGVAWWLARRGTPIAVLAEKAGDVAVRSDGDTTWITGRESWAPVFEFVQCDSAAEVNALDATTFEGAHFYAWSWLDEGAGRIRSRMFAPDMGIVEDEATGAAAVRITARLERDLEIEQGTGSRIRTVLGSGVNAGTVDVGGRTVFDRTLTL